MGFTYKSDLTQSSDASPDKSLVQNSNGSVPRDTNAGETVSNKKKWIKRCVAVLKLVVLALIFLWIGRQLQKSWADIAQYEWRPRYSWIVLSGIFYIVAFLPSATLWYLSLRWFGQEPGYWDSIKAFYLSQLGKYVPGKAMVVIIRADSIAGPKVRASIAAVSVFYETLTMMGSGAFIAALIVLCLFRQHWFFSCMALGVAVASCVPLLPPVFVRILKLLRIGANDPQVQESLRSLKYSCLIKGFALTSVLWLFFGLSLWAAICGIGIVPQPLLTALPRYVSVGALAMALGFAVPISPGGLGIREAVLSALLIPYFVVILQYPENESFSIAPEALATIVSLLQRIVSIFAEVAAVALLFAAVPAIKKTWNLLSKKTEKSEVESF